MTGTICLDEIEQNQAMLFKSYNVHHLIWTYCLLNCCIHLISHLQTPLIIFKSCHSLQFIAISKSSIIIKEALHTAQRISYLHHYTLFIITRRFVSFHNSAMNKTPVIWAVRGFCLTLHSRNQHDQHVCDTLLKAAKTDILVFVVSLTVHFLCISISSS